MKAVNWNDHPDIYHAEVGLGGELSIFYPDWSNEIVVPNNITEQGLIELVQSTTG